ncbi:MAG: LptF/LptG family permease [Acidobacteriota bacterium]|nr:LptF/LptG family permease [Acidobacteriota bacterium]
MKFFGVLDRLTVREIFAPTALGFVTYTFLVVMRGIYNLIEQVLVRGVSPADAAKVLLITLPHVVVLTIPMSFLFGVLLAAGRMNADSELVALQAGGIPIRRLLRPILAFALVLAAFNAYLYLFIIPDSSTQLRDLKVKLFAGAKNLGRIDPQVFHEEIPNALLYLRDVDSDTGEWQDIMLFDNSNPNEERLTLARTGRMVSAGGAGSIDPISASGPLPEPEHWIRLEDVVTHQFSRDDPETYRVNRTTSQLIRPSFDGGGTIQYRLSMRERSSGQLIRYLLGGSLVDADGQPESGDATPEITRRHASIELNKRLAIPFACVVFGLLALPLGVGSGSGGRGKGFVISVAVVLAYYLVNNQGEVLALKGAVPTWIGIWLPNIVLSIVAIALMVRMGRWLGEREPRENVVVRGFKAFKTWWQRHRRPQTTSRVFSDEMTGSMPISIQRRRYANIFPALLDRYLTGRLLPPLLLVLCSTALLYVVVDLSDAIEDMTKNHISADVIFTYYANRIPQVFLDVTPMALMISVLILLTVMEQQRELTALKAAGISLYRLTVPVLLVAAVAAGGLWMLGEFIVPDSNREAQRLRDVIKGTDTARSYRSNDRQWLLSRNDESLYNFLRYDGETRTLIRFTMFQIDDDMNLKFHLFTRRARFLDGKWIADSGWFRQFYPDGTDVFRRISAPLELKIDEGPNYFGQEYRRPSEMTAGELRNYISELVDSGYRPANLIVQWHQKFTYPLSAFVMVLLSLPFALSRGGRRVSTMQGVAVALTLGIAYFMLVALFGKLGEVEVLPPVIGAWAPVLLATLFAVNRLTTLRT